MPRFEVTLWFDGDEAEVKYKLDKIIENYEPESYTLERAVDYKVLKVVSSKDRYYKIDLNDLEASLEVERRDRYQFLLDYSARTTISSSDDVDIVLVRDGHNDDESWNKFEDRVKELLSN
jgi:hypothetical protein